MFPFIRLYQAGLLSVFSTEEFSLIDRNNFEMTIGQSLPNSEEIISVVQGDIVHMPMRHVSATFSSYGKPNGIIL